MRFFLIVSHVVVILFFKKDRFLFSTAATRVCTHNQSRRSYAPQSAVTSLSKLPFSPLPSRVSRRHVCRDFLILLPARLFSSPLFISTPSSSPSPHCRCHRLFQEQVEQHPAPLRFCLNDLTSNADRPQPPPSASLVPELLYPPPLSFFPAASLYTPLLFLRVCFHLISARLAPPLSVSPSSLPLLPPLYNLRVFPQGPLLVAMVTEGSPNSGFFFSSCEG